MNNKENVAICYSSFTCSPLAPPWRRGSSVRHAASPETSCSSPPSSAAPHPAWAPPSTAYSSWPSVYPPQVQPPSSWLVSSPSLGSYPCLESSLWSPAFLPPRLPSPSDPYPASSSTGSPLCLETSWQTYPCRTVRVRQRISVCGSVRRCGFSSDRHRHRSLRAG